MKISTINSANQYRYELSEVEGVAVGLAMTDELLELVTGSNNHTAFIFASHARKVLLLALTNYREHLLDRNDANNAKAWADDPGPGD